MLRNPDWNSNGMAKINDFMTVGDAAAYLGVSKDSLRRWDRASKLQARRHPVSRYRLLSLTFIPYILSTKDLRFDALRMRSMLSGLIIPVIWRER